MYKDIMETSKMFNALKNEIYSEIKSIRCDVQELKEYSITSRYKFKVIEYVVAIVLPIIVSTVITVIVNKLLM